MTQQSESGTHREFGQARPDCIQFTTNVIIELGDEIPTVREGALAVTQNLSIRTALHSAVD